MLLNAFSLKGGKNIRGRASGSFAVIVCMLRVSSFGFRSRPGVYSLAASATLPILKRSPYLARTLSPWYFQKALVASLPPMRWMTRAPPGCSSTKSRKEKNSQKLFCFSLGNGPLASRLEVAVVLPRSRPGVPRKLVTRQRE